MSREKRKELWTLMGKDFNGVFVFKGYTMPKK